MHTDFFCTLPSDQSKVVERNAVRVFGVFWTIGGAWRYRDYRLTCKSEPKELCILWLTD
jgi:hypothetical protein